MTLVICDYRGMAKWFGAYYNQEVRFSTAVKCKKGAWVLTSLLIIKDEILIFIKVPVSIGSQKKRT